MKRYKNTLNRPLPVALRTTSISVSAKGVFEVGSGQESNELKRLVDIGILRFLEETVQMTVQEKPDEVVAVSGLVAVSPPVDPVVNVDNSGDITLPMEVSQSKETGDTLTNPDVVVESDVMFEDKAAHKHRSKRR